MDCTYKPRHRLYHPRTARGGIARFVITVICLGWLITFAYAIAHGQEKYTRTDPRDCVVVIGGCSGVVVSAEGHVLTAGHCKCGDMETVIFPDGRQLKATKVYDDKRGEGCVAFDVEGDGFTFLPVADSVPPKGTKVHSYGYPVREVDGETKRRFEHGVGEMLGGKIDQTDGDEFFCNVTTDMNLAPGWSGGPLLTMDNQVIGVCNGFEREVLPIIHTPIGPTSSRWVGWSTVRETYFAAVTPPDEFTVYLRQNCPPCKRFLNDCEEWDRERLRGVFNGIPFRAIYTNGSGPRFFCGGVETVGYEGRPALSAFVTKHLRPAKDAPTLPVTQRRKPVVPPVTEPYEPDTDAPLRIRKPLPVPEPDDLEEPQADSGVLPTDLQNIRVIAAVNLGSSVGVEVRKRIAEITEDKLQEYAREHGIDCVPYILSRDLNPAGFDAFAAATHIDVNRKLNVVAIVPQRDEMSGFVKGIIAGKIEKAVKQKVKDTPLTLIFQRDDPAEYRDATRALLAYAPDDSEPGEPFKPAEAGLLAIITDKLKPLDALRALWRKWLGGKK